MKARLLSSLVLTAACGGAPTAPTAPTAEPRPGDPPVALAAPPLARAPEPGPRPTLATAPAFTPPVPQALEIPGLPKVWLVERHGLPMVSVEVVVPAGSADDPSGKAGLAALTAEMMEQGAGRYGALEISRLFEQLGAVTAVEAGVDETTVHVTVLKGNLKRALELMGDVVARPRFEPAEWKRSQALWLDQLGARPFEPTDIAALVAKAVHYGPDHPYGHPTDGHTFTVKTLTLDAVKAFHKTHWRPDTATLVVVGDVTPEELKTLFVPAFAQWVRPKAGPPARPTATPPAGPWPRTVVVDRPDAAQTVFTLIAPGPRAADPAQMALELVNIPLGGSFTSRLNANLREDKGYTYGVRSGVAFQRIGGAWTVRTSVDTQVTAPALAELIKEIEGMAAGGPTPAELVKARATEQGETVSGYESLEGVAQRLSSLAANSLPPDFDRSFAEGTKKLPDADVVAAAKALSLRGATIVAVGDGKVIREAFQARGLPAPEARDADGRVLR